MDVLYCLSEKDDIKGEYEDYGVFYTFESALIGIYDLGIYKFHEIMKELGPRHSAKFLEDLKDINSIRQNYEPDRITYLFRKKFKIVQVKNFLTNKIALKNILRHINIRFMELSRIKTNKRICFPLQIMPEKIKSAWFKIDQYNAPEAIKYLEKHIMDKIDEFKVINPNVSQGIMERNNSDFIAVRFTDSQEFLLNKEVFSITLSPGTGYEKSLEHT